MCYIAIGCIAIEYNRSRRPQRLLVRAARFSPAAGKFGRQPGEFSSRPPFAGKRIFQISRRRFETRRPARSAVSTPCAVDEPLHQPSPGRTRRGTRRVEEMHRECAAAPVRQVQPHQASRLQVRPHHGRRHVAPADAAEQQGMLGAEIAEAPRLVGEDAEILPPVRVERSVSSS